MRFVVCIIFSKTIHLPLKHRKKCSIESYYLCLCFSLFLITVSKFRRDIFERLKYENIMSFAYVVSILFVCFRKKKFKIFICLFFCVLVVQGEWDQIFCYCC
eukprot:Rmarinus@m.13882